MMPIVDRLGDEFEGKVAVLQLDAGQKVNAELQSRYEVRGHPSFIVLDGDGLVVHRFFGPQAEGILRQAMLTVPSQ